MHASNVAHFNPRPHPEGKRRPDPSDHPPASTLAGVQAIFRYDVEVEIKAEAVFVKRQYVEIGLVAKDFSD